MSKSIEQSLEQLNGALQDLTSEVFRLVETLKSVIRPGVPATLDRPYVPAAVRIEVSAPPPASD